MNPLRPCSKKLKSDFTRIAILALGSELQNIKFTQPVETKFLKLVALSSFNAAAPFASLAELDIIQETK